jgi:hypothetical protein
MLRRHRGCRVRSWIGRLRSFATLVTILAALPGAFGTLALIAYWIAPLLVPWSSDFGDPPRLAHDEQLGRRHAGLSTFERSKVREV